MAHSSASTVPVPARCDSQDRSKLPPMCARSARLGRNRPKPLVAGGDHFVRLQKSWVHFVPVPDSLPKRSSEISRNCEWT